MNMQSNISIEIVIPTAVFNGVILNPNLLIDLIGEQELTKLKDFLFDNLKDKDGSPEFSDMQIHFFKYDEQTKEGSFRLKFKVNRVFCCSDFGNCADDYIDFKFDYIREQMNARASYFNWVLDN